MKLILTGFMLLIVVAVIVAIVGEDLD